METAENQIEISRLVVGSRLVVQCKNDNRVAVVSSISTEKVVLQICSPTGRTYRKICAAQTLIDFDGAIPYLGEGIRQENFAKYDLRW